MISIWDYIVYCMQRPISNKYNTLETKNNLKFILYYKKNAIILGDGLHVVHPLAGQGFNLILRDIEKLNELISNNLRLGLTIKDSNIPKDLSDSRKPENLLMGLGIDTTRKFFKSNKYLDPIKENILNNFSKSTLLKKITKRVANLGLS